ncbi:MAG: metallophosphatase [Candidatus Azobacteroides sp.]|nr:metallophosphatase [Candidatus Azobacteroides sp.]
MTESKLRNKLFLFLLVIPFLLSAQEKSLVILHFNDTHSWIEPLPLNDTRESDKGGVVRQASYIQEVRKETKNLFIFHSGDLVQGTPYFNLFGGEVEIAVANRLKTDASCLGNHEFDNGLDFLAKMIRRASFPFITTNFDFTGTPIEGLTKKYLILKRNGLKIGIIGLTIDPDNLVAKKNYKGVKYLDPLESANRTADFLKNEKKCDLVICLSHLGYYPNEDHFGDITLAKNSRNIDIILGGHTHTFLQQPDRRTNLDGKEVIIQQTGAYGINIGRMDVVLERKK